MHCILYIVLCVLYPLVPYLYFLFVSDLLPHYVDKCLNDYGSTSSCTSQLCVRDLKGKVSLVHHGPCDMDMSAPRVRAEDGGGRARHRHPAPEALRLAGPWPGQQGREAAATRAHHDGRRRGGHKLGAVRVQVRAVQNLGWRH